ncbi:MAG: hypothetical protein LCH54_14775 [Bacteroidetes bacterium]|nr:hypothetical protein [Bacteroidota bacterium]
MNTNLKSALLFSFGLFSILFLVDTIISFGVSKSEFREIGKINKIIRHLELPEIAIFGSSVSKVGVNSPLIQRETGFSVYNFSLDGTRFMQYKGLISELNTQNETTKVVILAETYFSFSQVKALTTFENYLPAIGKDNIYEPLYEIQPDLVWRCRYIPFYKYTFVPHTYYLSSFDGWKSFFSNSHSVDSLLGFGPVYRTWEPDQDEFLLKTKYYTINIDSVIVEKYISVILDLKTKGRSVVIILTPIYTEISKKLTDFNPIRQTLQEISIRTQTPFWDFTSTSICDNKSYFYNSNHLNKTGADLFSLMLADSIKTLNKTVKH